MSSHEYRVTNDATHLELCSGGQQLTQELLNRGYTEPDIRKILGQNLLRVMRRVEELAEPK